MDAQAELSKIAGSITSSVGTALQISKNISGKDLKMANKARSNLNQKIKAIKENKELATKLRAKLEVGGEK